MNAKRKAKGDSPLVELISNYTRVSSLMRRQRKSLKRRHAYVTLPRHYLTTAN